MRYAERLRPGGYLRQKHEQWFGIKHPNVAVRLNNLATLLQVTKRLGAAEWATAGAPGASCAPPL